MHTISLQQAFEKTEEMQQSFVWWKSLPLTERIAGVKKIRQNLLDNLEQYAKAITEDMHKPIAQSKAEVKKCAYLCEYYTEHSADFLQPQPIASQWSKSYITYEPLGVLLGVMPWNYPFWQVFRFVIPNLILGNTFVLKHASNVPLSAKLLEEAVNVACDDYPVYLNLFLPGKEVSEVIAHPAVKAVSLTGSEAAGRSVAETAGKYLKKCVLELGGSNALIVFNDADLDKTIDKAVQARMQNAGQSCIAAKRILVHRSIYDEFLKRYVDKVKQLKTGDKWDETTQIGAMAREDLAIELDNQIQKSVAMGAKVCIGGHRKDAFFEPTVLTDVTADMPVFTEETFGPVAVLMPFDTDDEAVELSNQSSFGLGVSLFTTDVQKAENMAKRFDEGSVYINEMTISDPAVPFGGIKNSGYGRELSQFAMYEFANIKPVVVK